MDNTTQNINNPLVSILMLTYNRAAYLREAIDSVLAQTYHNWELFVIDDGSTDATPALMEGYDDPRIHFIRHEDNQGLHARRRESLQYATGVYTAVLDSDDLWSSSEKLAHQVSYLENYPDCVLCGSFTRLIDAHGAELGVDTFATTDQTIRRVILRRNQFTHSGVLIRTTALHKTQGYQPILAEDLELFLQLGTVGDFANLPEVLTSHRVHQGSENDRGIKMASAVHQIITMHRREYPGFWVAWLKSQLRLWRGRLFR